MGRKQKLELTWIGKEKRERLEPRVLIENEAMGYAASAPDGSLGLRENVLIRGDNLLALKALEAEYVGKVKCIYIDPPYNTGDAFVHYNDGVEHSLWMSLIRDRLEILRRLLHPEGAIFVNIDFNEVHYLKVLMDEVFGRENFQREIIWRIGWLSGFKTRANNFIRNHDTVLFYSKDYEKFEFRKQYIPRKEFPPRYNDQQVKELKKKLSDFGLSSKHQEEFIVEMQEIGLPERYPIEDTWNSSPYDRLNSIAVVSFSGESVSKMLGVEELKGQKSEALIRRIYESVTKPGDLVLDSFAGTGTAGAVAQKMRRRWIMIEIHDHADTHIVPRLRKVIDGNDESGITKLYDWQGGGGYRYFRLAPSLLEKDQWGQLVISKDYKPEMLAEAVCKLMGFTYAPSQDHFWRHGHSTEADFIYVTTQRLTHDALRRLSHEVGEGRSLLVCCRAHDPNTFDNLTLRKIPQAVMTKCEWGRDDYSLNIQEAPSEPITAADLDDGDDSVEAAE